MIMHLFVDVLMVHDVTTPAQQLFNYLLSHGKVYNMEVFRMVPVPVAPLNDFHYGKYDADSDVIVNYFLYFIFDNKPSTVRVKTEVASVILILSLEALGRNS
jgi:hypothetical protein